MTALLPLAFTACLEGSDPITYPYTPIEQTTFAASLNVNLAASTKTASGLYYRDLSVGTGPTAASPSGGVYTALVYYDAYFTNGTRFDFRASPSAPYDPTIGGPPRRPVPGFEEGIVGMKVGGIRQLIMPPTLAYGEQGVVDQITQQYLIPPNTVLVFTVQLVGIQ